MLELIKCGKKASINKNDLYHKAFCRVLDDYNENPVDDIGPVLKKLVYYGVKDVITYNKPESLSQEEAEYNFQRVEVVRAMMANLTPVEFINVFPIRKDYDGARYEMKDYFYTRDYAKELDQNKPIGKEIDNFLWEYHNHEVSLFLVNMMGAASDLRLFQGQPGILEEWADKNGIRTFTLHKDQKGKGFFLDRESGKTTRIKRSAPRYLTVLQ